MRPLARCFQNSAMEHGKMHVGLIINDIANG